MNKADVLITFCLCVIAFNYFGMIQRGFSLWELTSVSVGSIIGYLILRKYL